MKILVEVGVQRSGTIPDGDLTPSTPVYQAIELNDFLGWYDLHHWREDGGEVSFKDVPELVELFIKDEIKMGSMKKL